MSPPPNHIIIEPKAPAQASVIWLHGLGADGHDFAPIVPQLGLPESHGIRFVFPHAPKRAVTINQGLIMRAWYDIKHPDLTLEEDEKGIQDSAHILHGCIQQELEAGIPHRRILVAGFSQGGAISLYGGLRYSQPLAGILALSTYLPLAKGLLAEENSMQKETPIMMAHGHLDPIVPIQQGKAAYTQLTRADYTVHWRTYPMQHTVCAEETQDIAGWLSGILIQD